MKFTFALLAVLMVSSSSFAADAPAQLVVTGYDAADIMSTLKLANVPFRQVGAQRQFSGRIDCVDYSGSNNDGADYLMAKYECRALKLTGASAKIVYDTLSKYVGGDAAMGKYFVGVDQIDCVQDTKTDGQGTDKIFTCTLSGFTPHE